MPEYMTSYPMTSLTLDAIACKEEDAVVVEYILKGNVPSSHLSQKFAMTA
jgi:hypothetical protein